jgi:hypothetical protein
MDHSTRHQKPLPQPNALDEDMIEFAWSERALLWIQLYHDLLFAAASTPAGPTVVVVDTVAFRDFTDALENEPTAVSDIARDRNEFREKKNHMVSAKRSAIKALSNRNNAEDDPLLITHVRITPDMLDRYGGLRGDSKPEEDIKQPDQEAGLWQFLNYAVREEYLSSTQCSRLARGWQRRSSTLLIRFAISRGSRANTLPSSGSVSPSRRSTWSSKPSFVQVEAM